MLTIVRRSKIPPREDLLERISLGGNDETREISVGMDVNDVRSDFSTSINCSLCNDAPTRFPAYTSCDPASNEWTLPSISFALFASAVQAQHESQGCKRISHDVRTLKGGACCYAPLSGTSPCNMRQSMKAVYRPALVT